MSIPIDEKIHPHLSRLLESTRNRLILTQVEAAVRFEMADERIEEREYDEQERLRRERVISRRVFRGKSHKRYSSLVVGLKEKGAGSADLQSAVSGQLDVDLRSIASQENIRGDPRGAVARYAELLPSEHWPAVLCMAQKPDAALLLKSRLTDLGLRPVPSGPLERFGIVKFGCPPEMAFAREIAGLAEVHSMAAPDTPVSVPEPLAVTTQMAEARQILGVTQEMAERCGQGVTLAVLDTGLDLTHPAFARVQRGDYRNFTRAEDEDLQGHGTHVASIAAGDDPSCAGMYCGIAPKCHLIAGKIISGRGVGDLESILYGMAWAVFEKRADVLSFSIGDRETPPNGRSIWTRACEEAFQQGTVVCVAAGNLDPSFPETIFVPGDAANAVTVGAIDKDLRLAPFSAQGSTNSGSPLFCKPNCVAPGVDIVAAQSSRAECPPDEVVDEMHARFSGTSMAAPAVAGCLALLKSKARLLGWEISPGELVGIFYAACRTVNAPSGEPYRSDIEIGHGLVDMGAAMQEIERLSGSRPHSTFTPFEEEKKVDPYSRRIEGKAWTPSQPDQSKAFVKGYCYRCGNRRYTETAFSPVWKCEVCEAPLCMVCWQIGYRRCDEHKKDKSINKPGKSEGTAISAPTAPETPPMKSGHINGKDVSSMKTNDGVSSELQAELDRRGEIFLNRFEAKVREAGSVFHPRTGEPFRVKPDIEPQMPKRIFGETRMFTLRSGPFGKKKMALVAVQLKDRGLKSTDGRLLPIREIFRWISGDDGLRFEDDTFYYVGIFSPVGWPDEWKSHAEFSGNAIYYLVEWREGTLWQVYGLDKPAKILKPVKNLFNPEIYSETKTRLERALENHPDLALKGGLTLLEPFLVEYHLDRAIVEEVVQESGGRYQIINHKGKSAIQRTVQ